jgi:hypothetical protein
MKTRGSAGDWTYCRPNVDLQETVDTAGSTWICRRLDILQAARVSAGDRTYCMQQKKSKQSVTFGLEYEKEITATKTRASKKNSKAIPVTGRGGL